MIMPASCRILLVDDEEGIRFTLGCLLKNEGYLVDVAAGHVDAIVCLQTAHYDLAFVDIMLAGDDGMAVLQDIKVISPTTQVIMFTGRPEVKTAAEAVRLGAFDYITKPVQHKTLLSVSRVALEEKRMKDERERYRANMAAIFQTISDSIVMVDKEGCLAHFNEAAGKVCGFTRDLIGREVAEISLGCGGACRTALLETLRTKASKELRRFECLMSGGNASIVSLKSTPITEADGTVSGAVAVIRDETPMVELEQLLGKRGQFHGIIGISAPMQRVYSLVEALADVPTTVLINGESGTGKELVAAALHYSGGRAKKPFVKVNCSALSEALLESELFGHVRGAFTGAIADKIGRFQKADGGTLFLDEIGDISPTIQMRLLRVLQESEFERVGESTPIKVDVRIIAATNKNLSEMVSQGMFRKDLYYRLNVVRLVLPSLKERLDDLGPLVSHFIAKFNDKFGRDIQSLSDDVMDIFHSHSWPGNVRELEHVIERASILCKANVINVHDLPEDLINSIPDLADTDSGKGTSLPPGQESLTLEEALRVANGNISRAASLLGISRSTMYRKMGENNQQM